MKGGWFGVGLGDWWCSVPWKSPLQNMEGIDKLGRVNSGEPNKQSRVAGRPSHPAEPALLHTVVNIHHLFQSVLMGVGISGSSSAKDGNLLCLIIDSRVVLKGFLVIAENNVLASPLDWAATTTQHTKTRNWQRRLHLPIEQQNNSKIGSWVGPRCCTTMLREHDAATRTCITNMNQYGTRGNAEPTTLNQHGSMPSSLPDVALPASGRQATSG